MSQTDYAQFEQKLPGDRTIMHILYGLHTVAWASAGMLAVIALIVNYIKRGDEPDALYVAHHNYMISTFWWTILWFVATAIITIPALISIIFSPIAFVIWFVIGLWYLYRCIKGWVRFNDNRAPL